jgi:hypothetical protein
MPSNRWLPLIFATTLAIPVALTVACTAGTSVAALDAGAAPPDGEVADALHGDAADGATHVPPPPADGPFACGSSTCSPTQFCLHSCRGDDPGPSCFPGNTCPSGFTSASGLPGACDGGVSCQPGPPQPTCVDQEPCTPGNFCIVQGRDYTESGCA